MAHIANYFFNTNCHQDGSRVTDARQRGHNVVQLSNS